MRILLISIFIMCFSQSLHASDLSLFSGRILASEFDSGFLKIRIDFSNGRFLQKGNRLMLWAPDVVFDDFKKCSGFIIGKTEKYILTRIKEIQRCKKIINFTAGQSISLKSDELKENIETALELNKILTKKRLALSSKLKTLKEFIDGHMEEVNAINKKYDTLIKKLNLEWKFALEKAHEQKIYNTQEYRNYAMRLDEVDFKIEKYLIEDDNFYTDRWSLDPSLYYKK
jgi:hypothetical protein